MSEQHPLLLVVDDDKDALRLKTLILKRGGFEIITAFDVPHARTQLESAMPDLVLTDLMMPGETGLELIKHIRQTDRLQHIPILVYSPMTSMRDEALELGAEDMLSPPVHPNRLIETIQDVIMRSRRPVDGD